VAGAIVAGRFDLVAVAFMIGGLALLTAGEGDPSMRRAGWALALLAAGTLVKLFPILVAAVALAWLWGRGLRRAAAVGAAVFAVVVLVVSSPFVVISPSGFAEQFTFQTERPVQIESTPASVVRVLGGAVVTGVDERPNAFRSQALEEGPTAAVAAVFGAVQLGTILLVLLWTAAAAPTTRRLPGLVVPAAAVVLAFVALGKVLSPQYVVWIAPFAPLLWLTGARGAAVLIGLAVLLTQLEFPHRYTSVVAGETGGALLLGARNAALLAALALLLVRLGRAARRAPAPAPAATYTGAGAN
jgi:uncharacterized membrane protein